MQCALADIAENSSKVHTLGLRVSLEEVELELGIFDLSVILTRCYLYRRGECLDGVFLLAFPKRHK